MIAERTKKSGVPDKYFVITNNDIIRVRYLVVYGQTPRMDSCDTSTQLNNVLIKWIYSHKCMAAMAAYAIILIAIGVSNSRTGYHVQQYLKQAMLKLFDFITTINFGGIRGLFKLLE